MTATPFPNQRLLLYYKGDISALVLFVQHANGSVCFPEPLPALSSAMENTPAAMPKVSLHPAQLLHHVNQSMNFAADLLKLQNGFTEFIDSPGGPITLHLARIMRLDPPHSLLESRHCRLKTLPELRRQPPVEIELLRRVYVNVMEG